MEETKRRNSDSVSSESRRRSDRKYESESRSLEKKTETKESGLRINETDQNRDYKESRSLQLKKRDTTSDRRESESKRRYDEGTRTRHEVTQSRVYSFRPTKYDCWHYLNDGVCSHGSSCRFNHYLRRNCKFFLSGTCMNGSACRFHHPVDRDGAEYTRQARSSDRRASESSGRFDERGHETGSSSRPEKRVRTTPDPRERDPRVRFDNINQRRDETVAGFKQARLEPGHGTIERTRREGQVNVQELQENRARDQQLHEEERLKDIDRQRSESRKRLDRMKQTVEFDTSHRVEKTLRDIGFKRSDGDGL